MIMASDQLFFLPPLLTIKIFRPTVSHVLQKIFIFQFRLGPFLRRVVLERTFLIQFPYGARGMVWPPGPSLIGGSGHRDR